MSTPLPQDGVESQGLHRPCPVPVLLARSWQLGLRFGARLFRVGLLSSGARPSFREIIRQARLAA